MHKGDIFMDKNKKASRHISILGFTLLAQGMVLIDLFCREPLNFLIRSNPTSILPFLLLLYTVFPGLLTGVFLFLATRNRGEDTMKREFMCGILVISINIMILGVGYCTFSLVEIYVHPLIFVMLGYGIITLIYAGRRRHLNRTDEQNGFRR